MTENKYYKCVTKSKEILDDTTETTKQKGAIKKCIRHSTPCNAETKVLFHEYFIK